MRGKYISTAIGFSKNKDPIEAAREASDMAKKEINNPSFTIVYTNSSADQQKILSSLNEQLGTNWIGISTDKIYTSPSKYDPDITLAILFIESEFMHFSISVAEKYRQKPQKKAFEAVKKAMHNMHADKYVDAYIQFTRTKSNDYGHIIRNPPYFVLTYISGAEIIKGKPRPGEEAEFLQGIIKYTGPNIPIFGGSASSSFEDYFENKAQNYQFAHGKMYRDSALVVFVVSNLHFSTDVEHGYKLTKDFAAITKLDKSGYEILEINGKEPVAEYARILGVSKEEYLKDPENFSLSRPFGLVQMNGETYIKEALPNKDGKTLHSTFKLFPHAMMNILEFDEKSTLNTLKNTVSDAISIQKGKKPAVALFCSCSGRRPLIDGIEKKDEENMRKKYKKLPYFGFYSFGEVGSTKEAAPQTHSQTITSLVIFDSILTEK